MNFRKIKKIKGETTIYPNRKAVVVEVINHNNVITDVDVLEAEANLNIELQNLINKAKKGYKINELFIKKLVDLIDNYGEEKYETGSLSYLSTGL